MVSASREIAAAPGQIFELIADPAQQPRWDGNDNLARARAGQRVRRAGDVFTMTLTGGNIRENHVVEFRGGPPDRLDPRRTRPGTARAPVAMGTRADRRGTHAGHPHLRLDPADGPEPLPASPGDHLSQAPRLPRPARDLRRRILTAARAASGRAGASADNRMGSPAAVRRPDVCWRSADTSPSSSRAGGRMS